MSWQYVLFDQDGTLTDSAPGIANGIAAALRCYGIEEDPADLKKFVGPPLQDVFREHYGFSAEEAVEVEQRFREYFQRQGWKENAPYPGLADFLQALREKGKHLIVATSKPEEAALQALEHFGLRAYFDVVCGSKSQDAERPTHNAAEASKAFMIRKALALAGVTDRSAAVMVGDRHHDVEGAHEVGLPAIGVLYGYGSREELTACRADALAEDLRQLFTILCEE